MKLTEKSSFIATVKSIVSIYFKKRSMNLLNQESVDVTSSKNNYLW